MFEVEGESNDFELEVLWKKQEVEEMVGVEDSAPQFVIEDDDDEEEGGGESRDGSSRAERSQKKQTKQSPSLAERLYSCLIDLLFCCGFTLPTKIQVDHYKINYVIWCV